ncbi:hypothetical protein ACEPAH_1538 [Sanghuangporus vaninii]
MSDEEIEQRALNDRDAAQQEALYGQRDESAKPDSELAQEQDGPGEGADAANDDDDAPAPAFLPRGKLNKPTVVKK